MTVTVRAVTGGAIAPLIGELAALRIAVFAEWPYLYAGDEAYEAEYLREFAAAEEAVLVLAEAEGRIVGAATASPLAGQEAGFVASFVAAGLEPGRLFYFGESVLLPQWRGQGIGHAFFDQREAQARACGYAEACFAAVIRPDDHPARPAGARSLEPFWRGRGYAPVPGLVCSIAWAEHGEAAESAKPLQVWRRAL